MVTTSTQSTGCAAAGSVRMRGWLSRTPSGVSTRSVSNGVRAHRVTSWSGAAISQAATLAPTAPVPTTAIALNCRCR
ncbi:hypothetical protein LRS12_05765 [Sphingomonas sp. J344]|nr:hypothetical protein [Sphingomonas sp. J344]MCR5870275.1 hypothetical protein [Sphingomonas sp. J344]